MILLMNVDNENPSEIEGTNVEIEGAGILDFELKGNTHQDSYTGKNLLNITNSGETINGITYKKNEDGSITLNGTATANTNIRISTQRITQPNTYSFGVTTDISSYANQLECGGYIYNSDGSYKYNLSTRTGKTPRTISNGEYITNFFIYIIAGQVFNNLTLYPQLELGSTTTEFEKFVGGIPSPNPDYPQPIEVVTGDNTINVHGKNLWDENTQVFTNQSRFNNPTKDSNNVWNFTITGSNGYAFATSKITLQAGTYTASAIVDNGYFIILKGSATQPNTFTLTEETEITFRVYRNGNVGDVVKLSNVMIEQNPTATPYQPYQSKDYEISLGDIELCKIGDYQDYIYKENGKWYLHKEIGKVNLEDYEYNKYGASAGYSRNTTTQIPNIKYVSVNTELGKGLCEKYQIHTGSGMSGNDAENHFAIDVSMFQVSIPSNDTPSGLFYYALATPTNTEITDTDLIEQLEAISNSALFDGVNYIDLNSDNLIGSYKITYSNWYEFDKILRSGYNINEDNDRITQKFANGHRKQFVSDYKDCIITLNLDTIDIDTTKEYLRQLKSGPYKYYSLENKEYKTAQFIIEKRPELKVNNSIGDNTDIDEYQVTLLRAGD